MFIQHNQRVKDLTLKMCLQQEAQKALPPDLAKLAAVPDDNPPPRNRPYPIWLTPPIPGLELDGVDEDLDELEAVALEKGHYITDKYTTDDEQAEISKLVEEDDPDAKREKKDSDDDYSDSGAEY